MLGGVVAGLFMAIHPLQHYLSTLATSDAVFTCFVALAVLAAMWLARGPTWWRALLLTLALGAGAATKLSPIFLAIGLSGFGLVLFLDPWLRQLPRFPGRAWRLLSRKASGHERTIGIMLLVQPVLVAAFFVVSYPYLWSDPIGRTKAIFDFRRFEMDSQANFWPQAAITTRPEAFRRTWENLNDRYSSTERVMHGLGDLIGRDWSGMSFDLYLAVPGLSGDGLHRLAPWFEQSRIAGHGRNRRTIGTDPRRVRCRLQPLLLAPAFTFAVEPWRPGRSGRQRTPGSAFVMAIAVRRSPHKSVASAIRSDLSG